MIRLAIATGRLVLALACQFVASGASADNDGKDLLQQCRKAIRLGELATNSGEQGPKFSDIDTADAFICLAFIGGLRDGELLGEVAALGGSRSPGRVICVPQQVDTDQLARVVVKYLEANPARLHERNSVLAFSALREAFPCPARP